MAFAERQRQEVDKLPMAVLYVKVEEVLILELSHTRRDITKMGRKEKCMKSTNRLLGGLVISGSVLAVLLPFVLGSYATAQTCVQAPSGLVSWWPGDGHANDISGVNHGTLQNGATFAAGMVGQAFILPGTTDYVRIDNATDLDILGDLTLDAWINLADVVFGQPNALGVGGDRAIVDKRDMAGTIVTYVFFIEGDRAPGIGTGSAPLGFFSGSSFVKSSILTWAPNTWYHVAVVKSGVTLTFYRDGAVVGTGTVSNAPSSLNSRLAIGAVPSNTGIFNPLVGALDEVEVFVRALSAPEIQAIFDAGSAGKCKGRTVGIDIKPGSFPNSINPKSRGTIPVAILSTPDFDAPEEVDKTSLAFGRTGDEDSLAFCTKSAEDVNSDGLLDQVCHFNTQDTAFQMGDTEGILRGMTVDGRPIEGRDSVRIID